MISFENDFDDFNTVVITYIFTDLKFLPSLLEGRKTFLPFWGAEFRRRRGQKNSISTGLAVL
jgi:hypothetical protein